MKICSHCKQEKPLAKFNKNRSKKDGYQDQCKICQRKTGLQYIHSEKGQINHQQYYQKYSKTPHGKIVRKLNVQKYQQRHPEQIKPRNAVSYAVITGKLQPPTDFKCSCCPAQAREYHHHRGYEPEHWLDVIPVCYKCHSKLHQKTMPT